ncbi:hypothetical protein BDA99DRAFT_463016 [Phascolomyces articulosus]|uniref:VWFA domain-containing protein n=1 Tax=Phascolomyces articulosus TaxID=60185 RepID=A0AAD5K0W6_9FUNG|nr:hypothetical protein BDA99DRAFT_463016 [Phascolomyces articulosus]
MSNADDNTTIVTTSSDNNKNNNPHATHLTSQNLKSARSAILFTKNAAFHSRTTLTLWLFNRMFEPIDPSYEHEGMSFLEISNNTLSSVPSTPTATVATQQQQQEGEETKIKQEEEIMILTPRTRILSIANEYCMVIMMDLSSSLATTDVNRGNIMIDNIHATLRNIMVGLAQPLPMPTTTSNFASFEPIIRLTVIAECSQFGSNINVIPILAEFPTMRVFLQNVRVTPSNVSSILKILHDNVAIFLRDLATFRQKLTKRRSKLGYELDVRRNHSSVMMDHEGEEGTHEGRDEFFDGTTTYMEPLQDTTLTATTTTTTTTTTGKSTKKKGQKDGKTSAPKKTKNTKSQTSNTQKSTTTSSTTTTTTNTRSRQQNRSNEHHSKKDIWGVGKTGSNLSYILHAGVFALDLLPPTGQRSLILLTDGVVKSNIQDEMIIRQLSSDGITCNVVQISAGPFMDCNFGFIPDTDILKFVASATGGQYIHIEELLWASPSLNHKNNYGSTATTPSTTGSLDILDRMMGELTLPQQKFLMHEIFLDKSVLRRGAGSGTTGTAATSPEKSQQNNYLAMGTAGGTTVGRGARNRFSWIPHAEPESVESKLLRYQEYVLPTPLSHVIAARTRQGFSLISITLDRRRVTPLNSSSSRGIGGGGHGGKKVQVVITLSLQWQPQITIEYRIRAVLSPNNDWILSSYFGTGTIFEDATYLSSSAGSINPNFSRLLAALINPKTEILIRANNTFSHLLGNWDQFQRRFQVMGIFTGGGTQGHSSNNSIGNLPGSAAILKISKLKQLLTTISEADKQLNTFLTVVESNTMNRRMMASSYISHFQEVWQKMDDSSDVRHYTSCWYDTHHHFDLILHFTPYYCYTYRNHSSSTTNYIASAEEAVISTVLDILTELLRQMTDFISNRGTFIKISPPVIASHSARMHEIQITHENLRTIHIDVRFFNTPLTTRLQIMEELMHILGTRIELNEGQILADLDIGHPSDSATVNHTTTTMATTRNNYRSSTAKIEIAKRPLFGLLMRDTEHYFGIAKGREEGYYRRRPTTAALLAGEYIVRNYLRRQRWSWDTKVAVPVEGIADDFYGLHSLHDLAFERLCQARLKEGYVLISFNENTCHFYKEFQDRNTTERSAQYFIWRDPAKHILTTEFWLEPVTRDAHRIERDIVQTEQRRLFQQDRKIISRLVTFDWTFVTGHQQQRGLSPPSSGKTIDESHLDNDLLGIHHIRKSMVIDISSVLRPSIFSIAVYPCPQQQQSVGDYHLNPSLPPNGMDSTTVAVTTTDPSQIHGVVWLQTERYLPLTAPVASITSPSKTDDSYNTRSWHGGSNNAMASPSISLIRGGNSSHYVGSACQCPRPDHEFLSHREALSDLPSSYRDVVLTHYYFQQYLCVLADCKLDTKSPLPNDSFWSSFFREIIHGSSSPETHASKSTLRFVRRITDMECFIKTFNPSTFIVALIPSLTTLVQGASDTSSSPGDGHLGFLLFECHRQTATSRMGEAYHDEEDESNNNNHSEHVSSGKGYTFKEIDFSSIKESILSPRLTHGFNHGGKTSNEEEDAQQHHKVLSDYKSRLLQDMTDIYSSCYAKSIYSSLLFGSMVADQDFDKVLDICEETVLDIDLTGYLNVQTLLKRHGRTSVDEWNSAQQRFNSVLEHYFEPIMYSKKRSQFIYCYRPAHVKIGQHHKSETTGAKLTKLADIVVSAQCPLFIRLEYTLKNSKQSTTMTLPLEFLPTSYEGQDALGQLFNYEPVDIGSLESPVASVDESSATVRLVCMTIPQTKYAPVVHSRHSHGCPAENPVHHQSSLFDNENEYREALSGLSTEKQDALIETKARLAWLLTEEVMHGLLRAGPVTDVVVRYIQSHLMKKNPFVDFPTTMVIPLVFVKDQQMSRRVFLEQLERNAMTPYKLVRVGDCFYATDQKEYTDIFDAGDSYFYRSSETTSQHQHQPQEGADFFMDLGIEVYSDKPSHPQQQTLQQQQQSSQQQENVAGSPNDEFCEGLGISIMEPDIFSDEENPTSTNNMVDHQQVYQQLYWLLIIPRSQTVQIYFYSKMPQSVNRSEIVRMTKVMINDAIERTNKLVLLQHLNATRVCSKYLLANTDAASNNANDMSSDESSDDSNDNGKSNYMDTTTATGGNLVEMLSTSGEEASFTPPKKFRPGQFACDVIFTWRFPLHWRLQPNIALNALSSDVLRHFTVRNRPNIFVCMRDDTVIYCTLHESTVVNHYTDGSIIDYPMNDDTQQHQQSMRATSPHNSLLAMGINDSMAFSHHSRAQSAQPTATSYSLSQQTQQDSHHGGGNNGTNNSSRRTSPRSSPGGKVHSTNSIQLSPEPRKSTRTVESRELVLEVYGVDLPNWISDELVDLLENRLMSHVTLKEVQQFLLRNPGSKLSRADIDFILPVDKTPAVHENMQLPTDICDRVQFARLLRESVLTNSIRVLTGNGLATSLKNYRLRQQYNNFNLGSRGSYFTHKDNLNPENAAVEELCFYYSCINRTPGVCTDLELNIGQGVAGVILSFNDFLIENDMQSTTTDTEKQPPDAMPRSLLSAFASKSAYNSNMGDQQHHQLHFGRSLSVDIWTVGQVDGRALYDHIYKCFRQSICDYIIEQSIASTLPLFEDGVGATEETPLEDISDVQFSALLSSLVHVLEGSYLWNNPSVNMVSYPVHLQPWSLNQVVQRLNADFIALNSNIKSAVGIQRFIHEHRQQQQESYNNTRKALHYKICYSCTDLKHEAQALMQPQKNIRYSMISGLNEFSTYRHFHGPTRPELTVASNTTVIEESAGGLNRSDVASILRTDQHSAHSRHESIASSNVPNNNNNNNNTKSIIPNKLLQKPMPSSHKDAAHRRAFHLVVLDAESFTLYTYNYTKPFVDQLTQSIEQTLTLQNNRARMLQNIMHQKLGLFRHSEAFSTICNDSAHTMAITAEDESTRGVEILKNLVNNNMFSTSSHHHHGMEPGSATTTTAVSRPSLSAASSATRLSNTKMGSTATLPTTVSTSISLHSSSSQLLTDCNTALQSAYTSPVHTVTTTLSDADQIPDYLTQHGTPFLNTFLQHSQLRAAHDKAFNVYIKWASRYSSAWMQKAGLESKRDRNDNNNASEMMSVTELRLILKSSRLLHFCRTPLVFSDIDPKRSGIFTNTNANVETIQQYHIREETMIWYEGLAHTFMEEYASYLQSVGMHVIVHGVSGNNNPSKEDQGVYLSHYKVADDFLVRSPVIYLLQVYPGGTIMCEARLTDVFVSVTLYTLHRRYGRLAAMSHSPYQHESSEKRRADFKDFTEECDRFKQKIHVNSFVYDFNLKFIQQSLDNAASLPSSVDLLGIIKNTFSLYYKPANYSRNRIISGIYELTPNEDQHHEEENSMKNLFSMVIRNASKYGFESLYTNGVPTACFISSNDTSFGKEKGHHHRQGSNNSCYRYTLLITDEHHGGGRMGQENHNSLGIDHYDYAESPRQQEMATTPTTITANSTKVIVQYFIIITYQEPKRFAAKKDRTWYHSPGYKPRALSGSPEEILEPEKHTLGDVTQKARQRIDDLMQQAVRSYHQDVMWNQLYQSIGNKKTIEQAEVQVLLKLVDEFYALDAISAEDSLQRFMQLNLSWERLLDTIHQFYPKTSKILLQQDDSSSIICRHLVLFNPSAIQEYFVHIIVTSSPSTSSSTTQKQPSVQIFSKSKQPRTITDALDRTEELFIGELAVILGYCLWKYTKN